jgi:predicted tellurium resistance membrane protein TerC
VSAAVVCRCHHSDRSARYRFFAGFSHYRRRHADEITIMVTAVILAVCVMMLSARPISSFVNRHPAVKILALSFLLLIGVSLIGEGLGMHIPKAYIYFAMVSQCLWK